MIGDDTTLAAGHLRRLGDYEMASQNCLRAMCDDATLNVIYGSADLVEDSVVVVPRLESVDDKQLLARHRGLLDSYVFMRQYHDPRIHNQNAPSDGLSERLFNLLERERFEALGSERYAGARQNLAALWAGSYTQETLEHLGGAEQLEWVISSLCREQLNSAPALEHVTRQIASVRGPVEALIGVHLIEMAANRCDQRRYAHEVLQLIACLGLNNERAQSDTDNAEISNETTMLKETLDPQDPETDDTHDNEHTGAGAEITPLDPTDGEQAALVRNAEHEHSVEPSLSELEQLPEHKAALESSLNSNGNSVDGYRVYDAASDEVISALELVDPRELKSLKLELDRCVDQHAYLIRRLAAHLQRHLQARQLRGWLDEQDEGELDTRRLTRMITDPTMPISYRVETEAPVRSTAVTILIDNSRSMLGRPIELAAVCTELLTRTLERCGVSCEVLGFTTVSMYGGATKARWRQAGEINNPGRLNSVRHIVYKPARMPWRRARERFAVMLKSDILKQNIDGEAVQWAHKRLLKRAEDKRLLIVVSDGAPSDAATLSANNKDLLVRHLRSVVNKVETQSPVHLMAIGIGHDVSEHYSNAVMIKNADELGTALLDQLTRMLIDSNSRFVA